MFIRILKHPELDYWQLDDSDGEKIAMIWGVYVFDQNWRVHLCEWTPSYELHYLEAQVQFKKGVSDADMERIDDFVRYHDSCQPVEYMHCHTVEACPQYRHWFFPKHGRAGVCQVSGFALQCEPETTEPDRVREEQHDAAIEEALQYCHENGV